jgi:hypothetical protein
VSNALFGLLTSEVVDLMASAACPMHVCEGQTTHPRKGEAGMATYVQSNSNTWHWCRNCSKYPSAPKKTQTTRPSWDLCEECKDKERKGNCRT